MDKKWADKLNDTIDEIKELGTFPIDMESKDILIALASAVHEIQEEINEVKSLCC